MKLTLSKVCRTSVAAAGVMVAASAASAESRPLDLETEFDLGHLGGALSLDTTAAVQAAAIDVSASIGNWQASIGSYLDGLLRSDRTPGVEGAAPEVNNEAKPGADVDDLVEEEVAAFKPTESAKTEPKVEADPLLLAPVLSHPMNCAECLKLAEQAAAADAQSEEIEESRVDDTAALQNLADWAGARVADAAATAATDEPDLATGESAFFDDATDESPTN